MKSWGGKTPISEKLGAIAPHFNRGDAPELRTEIVQSELGDMNWATVHFCTGQHYGGKITMTNKLIHHHIFIAKF